MFHKKIKKYIISIGFADQDARRELRTVEESREIVKNILDGYFDGYSVSYGEGKYTHEDGGIVRENNMMVTLYFARVAVVHKAADQIKKALNQESVAIEESKVTSYLY